MSEETYFKGDKCNGNDIEQGSCPCCASTNLNYSTLELLSESISYPWECEDCGSNGTEWFSLDFSGHNVKENNKIGKDMGEDTMEHIVEIHLLAMFSSIQMDKPDNFDEMIAYICRDITECADENFSYGDVVIGFRRFIQSI